MKIALFFPCKLPVAKYGGTERVVVWLAQGLSELGHTVTVIAGRGTELPDVSITEIDTAAGNRHDFDVTPFIPEDADIVHFFVPIHRPPAVPHLWTMQGNGRPGFDPGDKCVFVSRDHARRHGSEIFVHNGINLEEYSYSATKGEDLLYLGRLDNVKGWKTAVRVAKAARRKLVLAGGWRPSLNRNVEFVGKIGGPRKMKLLAASQAMLMPVEWPEPFGIVIPESLASGTPVIGRPLGSLPELLPEHVGGLSLDEDQLVAWAKNPHWSPTECRRHAEKFFGHLKMAERYLELYETLVETGTLTQVS